MEKRIVSWDIDGVVAKSSTPVLRQVELDFGIKVRQSQLTEFDALFYIISQKTGDPQIGNQALSYFLDNQIMSRSPPYRGAVFLVNLLDKMSYSQIAITSRPPQNKQMTLDWLDTHVPKLGPHLYIRSPDSSYDGDEFKLRTLQKFPRKSIVLHIEDKDTTTDLLRKYSYPVALMDRPWNRNYDSNGNRHYGWPSILMTIIRRSYL